MFFAHYMCFSLLLAYCIWWSGMEGRIYHGTLDQPGSGKFPYHVQLGYRTYRQGHLYISIFCGGTLLTLRYNNIFYVLKTIFNFMSKGLSLLLLTVDC